MAPSRAYYRSQEVVQRSFSNSRVCLYYHTNIPFGTDRVYGLLQGFGEEYPRTTTELEPR